MFTKRTFVHVVQLTLMVAGLVAAQDSAVKTDNTKMNKGDGSKGAITADKQKNGAADRVTTQKIRKAIMADKSISTYGHNVKLITRNGKVTLKGPVRSDSEKQSIASKALEIAGADNVDNQLSVEPKK